MNRKTAISYLSKLREQIHEEHDPDFDYPQASCNDPYCMALTIAIESLYELEKLIQENRGRLYGNGLIGG